MFHPVDVMRHTMSEIKSFHHESETHAFKLTKPLMLVLIVSLFVFPTDGRHSFTDDRLVKNNKRKEHVEWEQTHWPSQINR